MRIRSRFLCRREALLITQCRPLAHVVGYLLSGLQVSFCDDIDIRMEPYPEG
jgi:hypothetical protein